MRLIFFIEVVYLQIIFFTKKNILIISFFILILLLIFFLYFIPNFRLNPNVKSANAEPVSDEFIEKIKELTSGSQKIAYLTFDDGPTTSVTPKILDILKEENIKASFFVIGKNVDSHPEIVKRAYEEGHYIANHGYSHNNSILYKSSESFISEVKKTDLAIGKAIGIEDYCSHIFRFPNGFMAPLYKSQKEKAVLLLLEMNYTYIDWNCLNKDSERKYTNTQLLNNLKQSCENKNTLVVLMHDTKDVNNSSLVLKESIDYLRREGYEFRNFYEFVS